MTVRSRNNVVGGNGMAVVLNTAVSSHLRGDYLSASGLLLLDAFVQLLWHVLVQ